MAVQPFMGEIYFLRMEIKQLIAGVPLLKCKPCEFH